MTNTTLIAIAAGALAVIPFACFDASNAPSCTISCGTDDDCPGDLSCAPDGLCSTGGEVCTTGCTPGEFINCSDTTTLQACNAAGNGLASTACTSGCNAQAERCNACVPDAIGCDGTMLTTCASDGSGVATTECGASGCDAIAQRCNACVPDEFTCASPTELQRCMADGSANVAMESCQLPCVDGTPTVAAHCGYISPKWLENICDTPAAMPSLTITTTTYATSTDQICNGGIITQPAGPQICVVRYGTITIPTANLLTVNGPRAFALVADTALTISGSIDASANGTTNGPGGGTRVSGSAGGQDTGGGGAGFATSGGAGGAASGAGLGAAAGVALDPLSLNSFVGGPRPQTPGLFGTEPYPGGGGGAVLLIACKGTVTINGMIDVGGGGGDPGQDLIFGGGTTSDFNSASGGGAGGYLVMQGARIVVTSTAKLYSNGGGGGGGTSVADGAGNAGANGPQSTAAAPGGSGLGTGGSGGSGGRGSSIPTAGNGGPQSSGGGGGSAGMLQPYVPVGVTSMIDAAAVRSPGFNATRTVMTR